MENITLIAHHLE